MSATVILCILDGYGLSDEKAGNAVFAANTPNLDSIFVKYPNTAIEASGEFVGLPEGQMGNSEVGHFTIGAGRIVKQGLARINDADLSKNHVIQDIIKDQSIMSSGSTIHVVGLISDGGVHAHFDHMYDILKTLKSAGLDTKVHAICDGRDSSPRQAGKYLEQLEQFNIASICGRFYAMDRDNRWERTELAHNVISYGAKQLGVEQNSVVKEVRRKVFQSYQDILEEHYNTDLTDEFIIPAAHQDYTGLNDGDIIIFTNFRADRVRQLAGSLIDPNFEEFRRGKFSSVDAIGMMSYSSQLDAHMRIMFPKEAAQNTLGEYVSRETYKQLRIAETEKYAHVTFFFNGGREEPFEGEDRILIPSPKVQTYDLAPKMSAYEITDKLIDAIHSNKYNFICINYANADMVGHTGDFDATVKAVESVDQQLGRLLEAVNEASGRGMNIELLITADHGNAESMLSADGITPKTTHTTNKVPLIYIGGRDQFSIESATGLADISDLVKQLLS